MPNNPDYGKDYRTRNEFAGKRGLEGPYHEYLKYLQERQGMENPPKDETKEPKDFYREVEGSGARGLTEEDFTKMLKYMAMFMESSLPMPGPDEVEKREAEAMGLKPPPPRPPNTWKEIFKLGGSGFGR